MAHFSIAIYMMIDNYYQRHSRYWEVSGEGKQSDMKMILAQRTHGMLVRSAPETSG
jgi:hypothetical protein